MQEEAKMQEKKQNFMFFLKIVFWIALIISFFVGYYYGIRWFFKLANTPEPNLFDLVFIAPAITYLVIIGVNIGWVVTIIKKSLFKKVYIQLLTWLLLLVSAIVLSTVLLLRSHSWF
jgi:hypothetical protein